MTPGTNVGNKYRSIFMLACLLFHAVSASCADAPERREILVRRDGRDYKSMVVRSQVNPAQWFCMLLNPQLSEYRENGVTHPDLWYYRFQRADPRNPNKLQDFAVLRCGFVLFPPENVRKAILSQLPRSGRSPTVLFPMPCNALELSIKTPGRKSIIGAASASRSINGVLDQDTADFIVSLETTDANLADRLLLEPAGLDFELLARLAPRGDLSWRDRISGVASQPVRSASKSMQGWASTATKSGGAAAVRDWRRTVPSRSQVLDKTRYSATITPRTPVGKSQRALQDIRLLERERSSLRAACKGYFTFVPYPESVRAEHMILEEAQEDWRNTYFVLPMPELPDSVMIDTIEMDITLCRGRDEYSCQTVTWKPGTRWRDEDRLPKTVLRFSLKDLMAGLGDPLSDAVFRIRTTIRSEDRDSLVSVEEIPAVTGEIPIADPLSICDLLTLDFHLLDWTAPADDPNRLVKIEVSLRQGDRRVSRVAQVKKAYDGSVEIPDGISWLVPSGSLDVPGAVEANVFFRTASGRRIPWALNGQPREQVFAGGSWIFTDEDWKPATEGI